MLDFDKYKKLKFNRNTKIDEKIKALFLLFDKYVDEYKLGYFQKQKLINIWIKNFIEYEEYEVAEAFKQRKFRMQKKWRKVHRLASAKLFWRVWRKRINKLFKTIKFFFNRS